MWFVYLEQKAIREILSHHEAGATVQLVHPAGPGLGSDNRQPLSGCQAGSPEANESID